MDAPSPRELPEAYVPGWVEPGSRDDDEDDGRHRAPKVADEVPTEVVREANAYLAAHPERDGGLRLGWRGGKRTLFVGIAGTNTDVSDAERELRHDCVVVEPRPRPVVELEALVDRIVDDRAGLGEAGLHFHGGGIDPQAGVAEIEVSGGADRESAQQIVTSRYGPHVRVEWLGPSAYRELPQPFGSYATDGRRLRIFYGLDPNGVLPGRAEVVEQSPTAVVVSVTQRDPVGPKTCVGGFTAQHADLELEQELGDRQVIDHATGEARPSVAELR